MANTFTNLVPMIYSNLDVVSRELIGFANSVTLDAKASQAAVGQEVLAFQTQPATVTDITPGVTPPDDGNQTVNNVSIVITKQKRSPFRWTGDEIVGLNSGPGSNAVMNDNIQQALRAIVNQMEADIFAAARIAASRAVGTAQTTPFASTLADAANVKKVLDDNGAPMGMRSLIINTTTGVNLRTLTQLTKVNEAGTQMTLRDGELLDLFGLSVKESAAITPVTKGTGASYLVNGTLAVGATTITADGGTGTILAGDVVTFAGDTNKYVVTSALSGGSFTIGRPGLLIAPADNAAITVGNTATQSVAFSKDAVVLATRLPALPNGGDMASNATTITDPRSGISFRFAEYKQFHQTTYELEAVWGVKGIKPEHTVLLLG